MRLAGARPTEVTYTTAMDAHARAGDPPAVLRLFEEMVAAGLRPDAFSYTTMVSAHARTANVEAAVDLLERAMPAARVTPTVVTWTAALHACARARPPRRREALRLFGRMREARVAPNGVALRALDHAVSGMAPRELEDLRAESPSD